MDEIQTVQKAVQWGSRQLNRLVVRGQLPTTEAIDVMAAEFSGDACEKFALDPDRWKDHVWEWLRLMGRQRLRGVQ